MTTPQPNQFEPKARPVFRAGAGALGAAECWAGINRIAGGTARGDGWGMLVTGVGMLTIALTGYFWFPGRRSK